ncbi:uncharacterized protein LOC142775095 [Rhipicephalus microplus]|uniref:uncharacterized protein LOC142775095 n=1 Tax=Rhipicephalus microplus TaxID=6941 RepID=UPI003F6BC8F2
MQNLHNVLARLQDAGLKREKCVFLLASVEYQGHIISEAGLTPAPHKVEAILKALKPRNKKELQSYLGLINFYRRFLPNLSAHLQPLQILLRDGQNSVWRKKQDITCEHSKQLITKAPVLVHFDPAKLVLLTVAASPYRVGAVLVHRDDKNGQERPVSFASRLHTAEQRYSQLDKEGLPLMFCAERFYKHLWSQKFEAVTGHKPLLGQLGPDKMLAAYSNQLEYRPGKDVGPADALSRLPLPEVPAAVPEPAELLMLEHAYREVISRSAVLQMTSWYPVLSQMVKAASRGEELVQQPYSHKAAELSLRAFWREKDKNGGLVPRLVAWTGPGHCSHGAELPSLPGTSTGFVSCGDHPMTILPAALVPPSGATIAALRQIFAAQGLPDATVSDNGPAFASAQYLGWLTINGIHRMMVPPYHPASNGTAERVVQSIKEKLKKSQLKQKLAADKGCHPGPLPEPEIPVFARNFRSGPPWSAGQVVSPASSSSLLVRMQDGTTWHRHADHVRANRGTGLASAAAPATASENPFRNEQASPVVRHLGHRQVQCHTCQPWQNLRKNLERLRQHLMLPHLVPRHLYPGGVTEDEEHQTAFRLPKATLNRLGLVIVFRVQ